MKKYIEELKEYKNNLFDNKIGEVARDYLKSRNIKPSTAKFWHLGYCPDNFVPKCYEYENKTSDEQYHFWTKMSGRLIMPILNQNGELISLSGRTLHEDVKPKYIHYPFPARKTLFGLYQNRKEIMNENIVIFTEGQFDVISAWQKGFKLCCCTFGAHYSNDHFAISSRYTNRINILYDADTAGTTGAEASLLKNNIRGDMQIKILKYFLRNGEDLDNWIQHNDYHQIINFINKKKEDILTSKLKKMLY